MSDGEGFSESERETGGTEFPLDRREVFVLVLASTSIALPIGAETITATIVDSGAFLCRRCPSHQVTMYRGSRRESKRVGGKWLCEKEWAYDESRTVSSQRRPGPYRPSASQDSTWKRPCHAGVQDADSSCPPNR